MKTRFSFLMLRCFLASAIILLCVSFSSEKANALPETPPASVSSLKFPQPCELYIESLVPLTAHTAWSSSPKYQKISIGGCDYWIVYYDRKICGTSPDYCYYETCVSGIVYIGEGCEQRSRADIIHAFHKKVYIDDAAALSDCWPYCLPSGGAGPVTTFSVGACYQKDANGNIIYVNGKPVNCSNQTMCCENTKYLSVQHSKYIETYVTLDTNGFEGVFQATGHEGGLSPDILCATTCASVCNDAVQMTVANGAALCNAPCNEEPWVPQPAKTIAIPGCPGCSVIVNYKSRTTAPCPETDMLSCNDIYLDGIDFPDGSGCNNTCNLSMNAIHAMVLDELLRKDFSNMPPANSSADYYRIFQSSCWADIYYPFPFFVRQMHSCGDTGCCWKRYRLTTDGDGKVASYQVLESHASAPDCSIQPHPCTFMCGD